MKKYKSNAERQKAYRERKKRQERNGISLRVKAKQIKLKRPALSYYGGKYRLASWIIEQFPFHNSYVEPFGGAASILLSKIPSTIEVFNDLNSDVVNFFHVLREYPDKLIRNIELTPYSREEHARAWETSDDVIERARRFYVCSGQSFGSCTSDTSAAAGWKYTKTVVREKSNPDARIGWGDTSNLWLVAQRLRDVYIEHDDAIKVMSRFDTKDTLFYVDPPYLSSTRSKTWANKAYSHEMTEDDHKKLSRFLHDVDGMVILSGYSSDLYQELYSDWEMISKESATISHQSKTECLWLSRSAKKLPLFS